MLSRTAEDLFWMARYVERADNVGRLVEAGRRFESLSNPQSGLGNEWTAILIAAGCKDTFGDGLETASAQAAVLHLVLDENNPSSIRSSFANARGSMLPCSGARSKAPCSATPDTGSWLWAS